MKRLMHTMVAGVILVGLVAASTTGCAWSVGGGGTGTRIVEPTRGQELIDLKRALDQGAITAEEYESARRKYLE